MGLVPFPVMLRVVMRKAAVAGMGSLTCGDIRSGSTGDPGVRKERKNSMHLLFF